MVSGKNKPLARYVHGRLYMVYARVRPGCRAVCLTSSEDHKTAVAASDSAVESYGYHSSCVIAPKPKGGLVVYRRYS